MSANAEETTEQVPVEAIVLLPCPFCGSEADYFSDPHDHGTDHIVDCRECYCRVMCGRKEFAIKNWNMRDGDTCHKGCKITRAVKEMNEGLTPNY